MRKLLLFLAAAALTSTMAFAQSSGSFNYNSDLTTCEDVNGVLNGGTTGGMGSLSTSLKVSSGNGVAILVRPSAVTGLLTDVAVKGNQGGGVQTATAQASIQFQVTVTPQGNNAVPTVTPSAPVTYDDRFLGITTNLFDLLSECTVANPCTFEIDMTTLSAHSFDYVVTGLSAGNYTITVNWTITTNGSQSNTVPTPALGCVGPLMLTATQVKIFTQSGGIQM